MAEGVPQKAAAYMAANPPPPFELWVCNRTAFDLFTFLSTQWHVGANGASGLIYAEAYRRMDELGITRQKKRLTLMADMRAMESEVLVAMRERREQSN